MAHGDLRVYLGAAPGVGKTYAMLAEARRRQARGTDVVIGLLESHGRRLTEQMADGLERIPRRHVDYRGHRLSEMDLDGILARRPKVVLVDEFAHTNVPGSRNAKRWQDVEELLAAGIDVITTLNIQHLESLADVAEHIIGVRRGETIPDEVVRRASQVELVDMTPEALRRRMIHGNVYPPDRVEVALTHYFRPGNLTALRELALLWVADRVEEGLQRYRAEHDITTSWDTRERIMVALTGGPEGEALLHRAARIAARTPGSDLIAVHVVRDDGLAVSEAGSLAAQRVLVESMGGSYRRVLGDDIARTLVEFAAAESITQIVLGASRRNQILATVVGDNVGPRVIRSSGQIDVHIVTQEAASAPPRPGLPRLMYAHGTGHVAGAALAAATLLLAVTAGVELVAPQVGLYAAPPLYLIAIAVAALLGGTPVALGAVVVASLLTVVYLVPPQHPLVVDVGTTLALAVILMSGLLVTVLLARTASVRGRAADLSAEAAALAALAARAVRNPNDLPALLEQLRETLRLRGVSLVERAPQSDAAQPAWFVLASAGEAPPERPQNADIDIPVDTDMVMAGRGRTLTAADRRVLASCATQIAAAVREQRLAQRAAEATERAADQRARGTLLQLACRDLDEAVTGARRALGRNGARTAGDDLADVVANVDRVGQIVTTLRDLSRLRFGALDVFPRATDLDEVLTAALDALGPGRCRLDLDVPDDLPDVVADTAALTRILTSLITRALRRSSAGLPPALTATAGSDCVEVRVVDHGPQVNPDDATTTPVGSLTLALAKELAAAMGATLRTSETPGGGLTATIGLRPATVDRAERIDGLRLQ